ncbi:partial 5-keto-4-deoxy-D-glucarate aldolase, partial [Gammaproteobacteria bacterium]
MRNNIAKQKMRAGQPIFGALLKMPAPPAVELCALGGMDFVLLDAEHGSIDVHVAEEMVRAAEASGIAPFVRVPDTSASTMTRYLDIGVMGIQAPNISSKEEALHVVQCCRYFPEGKRTTGKTRAACYGAESNLASYMKEANRELLVAVVIEDQQGLENMDDILDVQGLDVICVGPLDLAHSMGLSDQQHPQVQTAIQNMASQARRSS